MEEVKIVNGPSRERLADAYFTGPMAVQLELEGGRTITANILEAKPGAPHLDKECFSGADDWEILVVINEEGSVRKFVYTVEYNVKTQSGSMQPRKG